MAPHNRPAQRNSFVSMIEIIIDASVSSCLLLFSHICGTRVHIGAKGSTSTYNPLNVLLTRAFRPFPREPFNKFNDFVAKKWSLLRFYRHAFIPNLMCFRRQTRKWLSFCITFHVTCRIMSFAHVFNILAYH